MLPPISAIVEDLSAVGGVVLLALAACALMVGLSALMIRLFRPGILRTKAGAEHGQIGTEAAHRAAPPSNV